MATRRRRLPIGQSMAWWAVVLALVGVPLMSLAIDISRLLYVRTHLQTAADAGCEAAAQGADFPLWQTGGPQRIQAAQAVANAQAAFWGTVVDRGLVQYQPALTSLVPQGTVMRCAAEASVARLIPFTPPMSVRVEAVARMRFNRQ